MPNQHFSIADLIISSSSLFSVPLPLPKLFLHCDFNTKPTSSYVVKRDINEFNNYFELDGKNSLSLWNFLSGR